MEGQAEDPVHEIKRLQRSINDLVSLLALPAIWRGNESSQIVQTLLDVLLRMLSVDFAYAKVNEVFDSPPAEIIRIAGSTKIKLSAAELGARLGKLFEYVKGAPPQMRNEFTIEGLSTFPVPLGVG